MVLQCLLRVLILPVIHGDHSLDHIAISGNELFQLFIILVVYMFRFRQGIKNIRNSCNKLVIHDGVEFRAARAADLFNIFEEYFSAVAVNGHAQEMIAVL